MIQTLGHLREQTALHIRRYQSAAGEPASRLHALAAAPWPPRTTRILATLWTIGVLLLLALSVYAHLYAVFPLDRQIHSDFEVLQQTPVTPLGKFLGDLAGPVGALVEYVVVLGLLTLFRLFRELISLAVAGPGAELVNVVTNTLVARPRPPSYHGTTLFNLGSHSFPSGHTANAVGLFGFLFFLSVLTQQAYPKWRPWLLAAEVLCVYFALDVGVSRILEGQHWPSDVLGGYLVGAFTLTAGIALYHRLAARAVTRVGRQVIQAGRNRSS